MLRPRCIVADFVFVQGLGGGSRSTWTTHGEPALYWPAGWLPNDHGFRDVGIYSFGYDANREKESLTNIQDFSKGLLASVDDCPAICVLDVRLTTFLDISRRRIATLPSQCYSSTAQMT